MSVSFTPYLSFRGQAREAMNFYQSVFGGELTVTTFADGGMTDGVDPNQIMHSQLDGAVSLMGSDTPDSMPYTDGSRITLAFSGDSAGLDSCRDYYAKLGDGGSNVLPLDLAPWGDYYGQLTDKYGITWMFDFSAPEVPDDASSLRAHSQDSL
ncbi:VOC family protein [Gryllotalpicola protaetiae]|uniref:VOC family protein n=1 Tax=Gryllotalpicola protaetiae TaxID=2419771 RepID=A0A387BJ45_9MICO|nr:VOC family protein [Gryllotalpicola protaetiae]AYG02718.1 VOC family protein [Gryllotalpicola protaetiae]